MNKKKMHVGSARLGNQKGITLIALIITIIVMLILVAVTISMAINGGLFQKAGEAVGDTKNAINKEQELANGRVQIDGVWYDSIDDYLSGNELSNQGGTTDEVTLKVGDYVNYTPTTGTYTVASGDKGSGYTSNQTFTTETGEDALEWRVLSIDESTGKIELVSATAAQISTTLYLQKENGYNHGVDILNDLCEALYGNSNGATARSIKVEDINSKTTYAYKENTSYGKIYTPSDKQYPNIYASELGSTASGLEETADLLEKSTRAETGTVNASGVTEYSKYIGSSTADTLYATYTYYFYKVENYLNTNLGVNTAPEGLLNVGTEYWVASRTVVATSSYAAFDIRYIGDDGDLTAYVAFYSWGDEEQNATSSSGCENMAVRPVVTLGSNVSLSLDNKNTTEEVTYWNIEFK